MTKRKQDRLWNLAENVVLLAGAAAVLVATVWLLVQLVVIAWA